MAVRIVSVQGWIRGPCDRGDRGDCPPEKKNPIWDFSDVIRVVRFEICLKSIKLSLNRPVTRGVVLNVFILLSQTKDGFVNYLLADLDPSIVRLLRFLILKND